MADEIEISAVAVNALRRLNGMEGSALIDRSLLRLEDDLKELGVLPEPTTCVHGMDGVASVRKMATRACGDELVRRKLKACAEAFLAKSVIVCEGKTELVIVRALEEAGRAHLSLRGVAPVDANGSAEISKLAHLMNS